VRSQRARERSIRRFIHLFIAVTIQSGLSMLSSSHLLAHKIENHSFCSQLPCQPPDMSSFPEQPLIGLLVNASFTGEIGHLEVRKFFSNVAGEVHSVPQHFSDIRNRQFWIRNGVGVSCVEDIRVAPKIPVINSETRLEADENGNNRLKVRTCQ
jgi:hypothetical protein